MNKKFLVSGLVPLLLISMILVLINKNVEEDRETELIFKDPNYDFITLIPTVTKVELFNGEEYVTVWEGREELYLSTSGEENKLDEVSIPPGNYTRGRVFVEEVSVEFIGYEIKHYDVNQTVESEIDPYFVHDGIEGAVIFDLSFDVLTEKLDIEILSEE